MTATATQNESPKPLTQDEVVALAMRAKEDDGAFDEMMSKLMLESGARAKAERRVESLERQVGHLEHRLAVILQRMFGRSSEKLDPAQLRMFFEEAPATIAPEGDESAKETVSFTRTKKGHGRDAFPAHVRREDIPLEPALEERHCKVCGKDFCRIREEITERGHFVPGYWEVKRYIRGVWACRNGCGSIVTADLPPAIVDKSRFEPSVAVHTAVAKFGDHIPLERQSEMHARLGVEIAPTTLGDAASSIAALHAPTVTQMETEVLSEAHIHVDDTPVVVLVEAPKDQPKKIATAKDKKKLRKLARVWAYVALGGKVFYRFTEDRGRDSEGGPAEVLEKFRGCLIGDEYAGYDKLCRRPGMKQAGCWAHARRKFKDALDQEKARAGRVIAMMARLFWIEAAVKKRRDLGKKTIDDERHLALRRRRSKKQVEKIVAYARSIEGDALPKSGLGIALGYLLGNIEHFKTFLDDPRVPLENNAAERALRAVAVGRKNYLHIGSLAAGGAAVVLYSLIGSCKALGINPYAYLNDATKTLLANRETPRSELTPWAWAAAQAEKLKAAVATAPTG
jgi:transposase